MAMKEMKDGTFSEFESLQDFWKDQVKLAKQFIDDSRGEIDLFTDRVKAIHFGTEEELDSLKEEKTIQYRMDELEKKLEEHLQQEKMKNSSIHLPTREEIIRFAKQDIREKLNENDISKPVSKFEYDPNSATGN